MSEASSHAQTESEIARQSSRIIPPHVDTGIEVYGSFTIDDLLLFTPAAVVTIVAFVGLLFDIAILVVLTLPLAGGCVLIAGIVKISTQWYTTPRERVRNWLAYLRRARTLPWGHGDATDQTLHGVRRLRADGTAEMNDGCYVGLVRVSPRNTALLTTDKRASLADQLGRALDEEIRDFDIRFFATTTTPDQNAPVAPYRHMASEGVDALAADPQIARYRRALLNAVVDWQHETDAPQWGVQPWAYYVSVEVTPTDVDAAANPSLWQLVNPLADETERRTDERCQRVLTERLETVEESLSGIGGVDADRITAASHGQLLCRHWTGTDRNLSEDLLRTFERHRDPGVDNRTPAERLLTPGTFDADRDYVTVGDQYCRTFWLAEWPSDPAPLFLQELFTMRRVEIDVCIHVRAEDKRRKVTELEQTIADIDSEAMERADAAEVSAMDVERDIDAYLQYRELLRTTSAQPWAITGYVTVRADTEAALARAEQAVESYDTVSLAKEALLNDMCDDVRTTLESSPADCFAVAPGTRQQEAFISCSPTSRDAFAETATEEKTTSVPGGAVGAMFPFCATGIQESAGMDWGRNEQNGHHLTADPFDRGAAPHMMTIGQSRSGKTYASTKAAARWYAQSDDHTLIVCDTQSGFDGITKLLGGKHLVVDGTQTINPLDIQPLPEYVRESAGGQVDPYRMKIDEATQFISGVLRAQGIDPGPYVATIEEGLEATYAAADIYPNDFDSHAYESPTLANFIETLERMLASPGEFTHTTHEAEIAQKEKRVSDLLDKLSGFKPDGKYHHIVGETETSITEPDADMVYLDLQQLQGQSDAEKSVMLHLMLSQVYEKVKRTDGKLVFMIDEAHVLLHSDEMVQWLQKAAREWARYDACMWFISQSPREFLQQSGSKDVGQENHRRTIVDQCSTIHLFRTPRVAPETLAEFGLNDRQIAFVRDEATPGKAGKGYSECLIHFEDKHGWFPTYVEASPFEDHVLRYTPREHGDFEKYLEEIDKSIGTSRTTTETDEEESAAAGIAIEAIHGIGPTYAGRLRDEDIRTVDDLATMEPDQLATVAEAPIGEVENWISRTNETRLNGSSPSNKTG